ncbi:GNAT family N-acetyltransferase [Nocardiopsis sp. RSe5-2]|uniref:GNAT family N-acetyltransferase n=1 Tax=Nocardiopsis endophytica TaxID=3018445 RepID=A0ABT4U9H7_9ACTN|nr:GNAT family N-acetyltransferase [Nocardiopsis endophytica]MDA2813610.1 GNAT family N-acetyltransferase [Nocardiopsis endophytica]
MSAPAGRIERIGRIEGLTVRVADMADPGTAPLLEGLAGEYTARYGRRAAERELTGTPDAAFSAPAGGVVLVEDGGRAVAGGAFLRKDARTAEFKRIWTDSARRRQGLGRRAMAALEEAAAGRGYRRAYLTTGPEQPEAVAMYARLGYTLSSDEGTDPEGRRIYYAFAKDLAAPAERGGRPGAAGQAGVRAGEASYD